MDSQQHSHPKEDKKSQQEEKHHMVQPTIQQKHKNKRRKNIHQILTQTLPPNQALSTKYSTKTE